MNSQVLREILQEIFTVPPKYIIPLVSNEFAPTISAQEPVATWIGYRLLEIKPISRGFQQGVYMAVPLQTKCRICFVGPQAEDLALQTMLWNTRTDVVRAFEDRGYQLNYSHRIAYSSARIQGGANDELSWNVEFKVQSVYQVDTKQRRWDVKPFVPPDTSWLERQVSGTNLIMED